MTGCIRGAGQTPEKLKNRHIDDVFVGYLIKHTLPRLSEIGEKNVST